MGWRKEILQVTVEYELKLVQGSSLANSLSNIGAIDVVRQYEYLNFVVILQCTVTGV